MIIEEESNSPVAKVQEIEDLSKSYRHHKWNWSKVLTGTTLLSVVLVLVLGCQLYSFMTETIFHVFLKKE